MGECSYHCTKENLIFRYELKPMTDNRTIQCNTLVGRVKLLFKTNQL